MTGEKERLLIEYFVSTSAGMSKESLRAALCEFANVCPARGSGERETSGCSDGGENNEDVTNREQEKAVWQVSRRVSGASCPISSFV